jgi:S-adenosylmethionine-diacylglycerol 3-amino-3-carboxypropyl transferase
MSNRLLKAAVYDTPAITTKGVLDRLFALWFQRFVYNQIWEDPSVDLAALRIEPTSRVVTIASGGCNVLNYLLAGPRAIVAVDLNPAHIALTRLKLTAAAQLDDHEIFFRMFGRADDRLNREIYEAMLRPHLDAATRAFWDRRTVTGKRRIDYLAKGLYRHAVLGRFIGVLHRCAALTGRQPSRLLLARTLEEQARLFDAELAPLFDLRVVRALCRLPVTSYSLGIPPAQFGLLRGQAAGNLADLFRARVRRLACDFPIADNYFAWQGFGRSYDVEHRQALPDYLRAENYDALRAAVDRVETRVASMTDYLATQLPASLDRYVLLDAQDWMSPAQLVRLWRHIDHTARPGARVIFRTAADASPLEATLPRPLLRPWRYERALSAELLARDRSAIYGGFHVYGRDERGSGEAP